VHVADAKPLKDAFISSCGLGPSDIQPPKEGPCYRLSALVTRARKLRVINDCMQHALVAQGRIDAAVDFIMYPWDIAAIIPCVEEAGGVATDLEGTRAGVVWKPSLVTSSNPALHDQMLSVLQGVRLDRR
jgi:histidinol-phosphatase